MKTNLSIVLRTGRESELPERFDDRCELFVVGADAGVQLNQFLSKLSLVENHLAKSDKCAHHNETHLNRPPAIEDGCRHKCSMFSKGKGPFASAPATTV